MSERWAPNFSQSISGAHPERDRPLAVNFDGDWDATNNWSRLSVEYGRSRVTVYASVVLTRTHGYLTYTLFYPRDWFAPLCVPYLCHDNDLEVVSVVVTRATPETSSDLAFIETKAHNRYVAVSADEVAVDTGGRPWLRVESEGHGMYPIRAGERIPTREARSYVARLSATGASENVGSERYELEPLHETLWARRHAATTGGRLWTAGETGFLAYAGIRQGRLGSLLGASMAGREYPGGVRPPWGLRASVGERGDWFLDPAYVAALRHPEWLDPSATSLTYDFNPYLDDLQAECAGADCTVVALQSSMRPSAERVTSALLAAAGLLALRARRRSVVAWVRGALRRHLP